LRFNSKYFTFIAIALLLIQCTPTTKVINTNSSTPINGAITEQEQATKLIAPYKQKLDAEMNEVLVISSEEFPKEKGKTQTKLGNLVADLSLDVAQEIYGDSIDFCLLNFGGLRTSLPEGEITRGKIFELMPFENELVVITLTEDSLNSLIAYLKNVGGQPIGGKLYLSFTSEENQVIEDWEYKTHIKVLTSDYLANGGDNMKFFLNPIQHEKVGIKLRDAIIQYCQEQHQQGKQLVGKLDDRIVIEK
jgi:2',3'-cyclic-nucleotide 2'-phosphodiesterase (5'-nucleotidase family)